MYDADVHRLQNQYFRERIFNSVVQHHYVEPLQQELRKRLLKICRSFFQIVFIVITVKNILKLILR